MKQFPTGHDAPRLVYSTDSSGVSYDARGQEIGRDQLETPVQRETYAAARDLADALKTTYDHVLHEVIEVGGTQGAPSARIAQFVRAHGLDKSRVSTYSHESFQQYLTMHQHRYTPDDIQAYERWTDWVRRDDDDNAPPYATAPFLEVDDSGEGAAVVRFQLPKPLDSFWDKREAGEATSWGALYTELADVPWSVVRDWTRQHGDAYEVRRLNPVGVHDGGEDGFYYLFEVIPKAYHPSATSDIL